MRSIWPLLAIGMLLALRSVSSQSSVPRDVVVATQSQEWAGATLSFVIDITGSMFDDLLQVRNGVQNIFKAISEQQDVPVLNYALVTFHDPGTLLSAVYNTICIVSQYPCVISRVLMNSLFLSWFLVLVNDQTQCDYYSALGHTKKIVCSRFPDRPPRNGAECIFFWIFLHTSHQCESAHVVPTSSYVMEEQKVGRSASVIVVFRFLFHQTFSTCWVGCNN